MKEEEVRGEVCRRGRGSGQGLELTGQKQTPARDEASRDDREQCRKDPPDTAFIEVTERQVTGTNVGQQDAGDQIARDDEKDVDADIAAAERGDMGVIEHDRHDGETAQTIDVLAIGQVGTGC